MWQPVRAGSARRGQRACEMPRVRSGERRAAYVRIRVLRAQQKSGLVVRLLFRAFLRLTLPAVSGKDDTDRQGTVSESDSWQESNVPAIVRKKGIRGMSQNSSMHSNRGMMRCKGEVYHRPPREADTHALLNR